MPPLLPISDLSWIAIFQEFTPNEQLVASKMSLRCAGLVRAANRKVKSLVITASDLKDPSDLNIIKDQINCYSLASKPAMQPLMDIPGEPSFPDYPMTTRLSKWHCLKIWQVDTATIEQIVNIFSAVTDLKFIYSDIVPYVALLQHPNWQCQLTNLRVDETWEMSNQQACELITAINGLPALQHLALRWETNGIDLPDLTILAQLKVVAFSIRSDKLQAFVRSLEQYATDNADLQVHLRSSDTRGLLSLSQPLHSRIVCCDGQLNFSYAQMHRLCNQFRSLTSLSVDIICASDVGPLFTALSQLHQLVHLELELFWESDLELPTARPLAKMNSLRALDLRLTITSHSQIEWFNLPGTMSNLQAIHIQEFICSSCEIAFDGLDSSSLSPSALNCLQSSLFTLHTGVPLDRFILGLPREISISAENLLLQSASEPPVTAEQP